MGWQDTCTRISIYQLPAQGRFGTPTLTFQPGSKQIPVCAIIARSAIVPKLYWDTQAKPYSGEMEYVLRSKDGHVYTARTIIDIAKQHQSRSRKDQRASYLIESVEHVSI